MADSKINKIKVSNSKQWNNKKKETDNKIIIDYKKQKKNELWNILIEMDKTNVIIVRFL